MIVITQDTNYSARGMELTLRTLITHYIRGMIVITRDTNYTIGGIISTTQDTYNSIEGVGINIHDTNYLEGW